MNTAILVLALALGPFSSPAAAGDWYVDALHGSDANSGTSPADAWRTITHAVSAAPSPPAGEAQRIHVAPGTYDAALGEHFAIALRDAFQLIGDQGPEATILDGGGVGTLVSATSCSAPCAPPGPLTRIEGFTLRNAKTGLLASSGNGTVQLRGADLRIESMGWEGVYVGCHVQLIPPAQVALTLERVSIAGCTRGALVEGTGLGSGVGARLEMTDCSVEGSSTAGVELVQDGKGVALDCARTRIVGSAGDGIRLFHGAASFAETDTRATMTDCLIAGNAGCGILEQAAAGGSASNALAVEVRRCTIADNGSVGVSAFVATDVAGQVRTELDGSIVWGNLDDLDQNPARPAFQLVRYCDVGDGDFAGSEGNFSADPRFRGPAAGDYRLVWGSPCVDAGDPAAVPGIPDLAGVLRAVDGDLDVLEREDVGCLELATLALAAPVRVGGTAAFEQWGPAGGRAILHLARGAAAATPLTTPFGEFDLDPLAFRELGTMPTGAGPPALRTLPVPDDPAYVGITLTLQALASSTVGSPPAAWTNAVTLTIGP